jgi:recombination DNA repair RAD52 pathway protein
MSGYLTPQQIDLLLKRIHPQRVVKRSESGKELSYVEAHDVKAMMIRVYGFARWSWHIDSHEIKREEETKTKQGKDAWRVVALVRGTLTLFAPDGTHLADYSGLHAGSNVHPDYGEALGNAITNADSYAFKRAAIMALADQGGLSLYNKGQQSEIVRWTLVKPQGNSAEPVNTDDVPAVAPESEVTEDPREKNEAKPTPQPRENPRKPALDEIRDRALNPPADADAMWWSRLQLEASKAKVLNAKTADGSGVEMTLAALIQGQIKARAA